MYSNLRGKTAISRHCQCNTTHHIQGVNVLEQEHVHIIANHNLNNTSSCYRIWQKTSMFKRYHPNTISRNSSNVSYSRKAVHLILLHYIIACVSAAIIALILRTRDNMNCRRDYRWKHYSCQYDNQSSYVINDHSILKIQNVYLSRQCQGDHVII